jgi:hypothetical protein
MKTKGTVDALGLAAAFGALLWLLSLCHCAPNPVTPSSQPGCPGACEQGRAIGCEWADDGCEAFCDAYHAPGYMRPWADCVGQATSQDDVHDCGVSCEVTP